MAAVFLFAVCAAMSPSQQANQDATGVDKSDRDPSLHILRELDLRKPDEGEWNPIQAVGSLIRYYYVADKVKSDTFPRTLKVEITGAAVSFVGVCEIPMKRPSSTKSDLNKSNLSCFVKAEKEGTAIVKIAVIDSNGKQGPWLESKVKVLAKP
jgi:hypothetical protein